MNEAIYEAVYPILYRVELNHQIHFNCSSEQIFRQFCVSHFVLCYSQNFFGLYESSYILNISISWKTDIKGAAMRWLLSKTGYILRG